MSIVEKGGGELIMDPKQFAQKLSQLGKLGGHPLPLPYLAGIIDGEGCLTLYREGTTIGRGYQYHPLLRVTNTHIPLLNILKTSFGGFITVSQPKGNRKECGKWSLNSNGLRTILPQILPFLIVKRQNAELLIEALHYLKKKERVKNSNDIRLTEIYIELRKLNKRGR